MPREYKEWVEKQTTASMPNNDKKLILFPSNDAEVSIPVLFSLTIQSTARIFFYRGGAFECSTIPD